MSTNKITQYVAKTGCLNNEKNTVYRIKNVAKNADSIIVSVSVRNSESTCKPLIYISASSLIDSTARISPVVAINSYMTYYRNDSNCFIARIANILHGLVTFNRADLPFG